MPGSKEFDTQALCFATIDRFRHYLRYVTAISVATETRSTRTWAAADTGAAGEVVGD
jgi:hypothetical protein